MRYLAIIFVAFVLVPVSAAFGQFTPPPFLLQWGSYGTGDGEFNAPVGVAVGATTGNVYVGDAGNRRVQKFTAACDFVTKWGTEGSGDGEFRLPRWLDLDGAENVYVTDGMNHRVQKFDSDGTFITKWGGTPAFNDAIGIAVDVFDFAGNVYVTSQFTNHLQKFDLDGNHVATWTTLSRPHDVAVDSAGNVYVATFQNNKIQKFNSTGALLLQWGSAGAGDGQFYDVTGLAIDAGDNVYVCDRINHRIQVFDTAGNFLGKWGSNGAGEGQFQGPDGIAVAPNGNVYVADTGNHRIQVFGTAPPEDPTIEDLALVVLDLELDGGLENSLLSKLAGAIKSFESPNANKRGDGVNKLEAFIHQVEAQSGKKINSDDADPLIEYALFLIDLHAEFD